MTGGGESTAPEASSRGEKWGWYFYDWANSAFYTTVVTVLFGPYLTSLARRAAEPGGFVRLAGWRIHPQSVWPYAIAVSVILQVVALPVLGAIADYGRRKREMLAAFAYAGAAATVAMYWLEGSSYRAGCLLFLIANLSFGASVVIYNSFLPEIATAEERDDVSSKGWGFGYLGGGILLALNLWMYSSASRLGITEGQAVRISFASAGLWWALFTLIPVKTLRNRRPRKTAAAGETYLMTGLRQLRHTLGQVREYPQTLRFLVAYLIYNDAIQTVIALAAQFGSEELHLPISVLTGAILLAQFVAFFGAMLFGWIARALGNQRAVMVSLLIWSATLVYIYVSVTTAGQYYAMAGVIGIVLGGSQALSRSIFSLMIPKGQEAEYFSVYEISDKGTSWIGPLFFGLALQLTGSYRTAVLSLILFFIAGLILLARVDVRRAALEAGRE